VALADKSVVRGLVIIDSMFAPYPIPQEELERLRFQLGRDPARALRNFFGPMAKDARQLDKLVASAWRVSAPTLVSYLDFASERDDLRRRAGEISVPVHVMATPQLVDNQTDPARVRMALGQVGYSSVQNLSYDLFPRAKHWLFWDEPDAFHASLDKFLRRVEGALPVTAAPKGPAAAGTEKKKARPLARAPR
jgi:pimeloyl-ACP methyl ester carboxylesterase